MDFPKTKAIILLIQLFLVHILDDFVFLSNALVKSRQEKKLLSAGF
ncbi:MAG: DUF3307 domain-containing protein [Bacteroidetes bacterium]|nr:MAG: DUF3307 domain-containing protein [Bacteroidota bacterium]